VLQPAYGRATLLRVEIDVAGQISPTVTMAIC
jgi:hypothetical protein